MSYLEEERRKTLRKAYAPVLDPIENRLDNLESIYPSLKGFSRVVSKKKEGEMGTPEDRNTVIGITEAAITVSNEINLRLGKMIVGLKKIEKSEVLFVPFKSIRAYVDRMNDITAQLDKVCVRLTHIKLGTKGDEEE